MPFPSAMALGEREEPLAMALATLAEVPGQSEVIADSTRGLFVD